jgi:hypothetical protein
LPYVHIRHLWVPESLLFTKYISVSFITQLGFPSSRGLEINFRVNLF